jgi:hypothetical protein
MHAHGPLTRILAPDWEGFGNISRDGRIEHLKHQETLCIGIFARGTRIKG